MRIIEYAKEHPYATGTILIVGGFLFIVIVRGSSSNSTQYVDTGPSDAEIAANAAIQSAQIGAQASAAQAGAAVQAAQIGAGVQMNSDNKAAEAKLAEIAAAERMASINANAAVTAASYQRDIGYATLEANQAINAQNNAASVRAAEINANTQMNSDNKNAEMFAAQLAANMGIVNTVMNAQTEQQKIAAQTLMEQTRQAALVQLSSNATAAEIESKRIAQATLAEISRAEIRKQEIAAQSASDLALMEQQRQIEADRNNLEAKKIESYTTVTTAGINAQKEQSALQFQAAKEQAEYNAQQDALIISQLPYLKKKNRDNVLQAVITDQQYHPTPSNNSVTSDIANIAGSVASVAGIFSDDRLKSNIEYVGTNKRGVNIYEFNYNGSKRRYRGPMAREIARNDNGNNKRTITNKQGYLKVIDPALRPEMMHNPLFMIKQRLGI